MGGLSRRDKESRAFSAVVVGGGSAVAAVVFFVLGVIGVISIGWAFLAAIIAGGSAWFFNRTLK